MNRLPGMILSATVLAAGFTPLAYIFRTEYVIEHRLQAPERVHQIERELEQPPSLESLANPVMYTKKLHDEKSTLEKIPGYSAQLVEYDWRKNFDTPEAGGIALASIVFSLGLAAGVWPNKR